MNNRPGAAAPRNRYVAFNRLRARMVCGPLLICALLAAVPGLDLTPSAWAQMPDNRGVKFNPEDSAPPAYQDTLDVRDRVLLEAARRQGESFVPVIQGQGQEPGYEPRSGGAEPAWTATGTAPLLQRPGRVRTAPKPTYEAYRPQEENRSGRPDDGISDLLNVLLQT